MSRAPSVSATSSNSWKANVKHVDLDDLHIPAFAHSTLNPIYIHTTPINQYSLSLHSLCLSAMPWLWSLGGKGLQLLIRYFYQLLSEGPYYNNIYLTPMLASTLSSNPSKRATFSEASDSSHSHKPLSHSSIASKSASNQDLLQQIAVLKQKAHQSFMQVIQIQQLHQEELEQLRSQFSLKETEYQNELEGLRTKIVQLEYQNSTIDKNARHHNFSLADELSIESIEPISCLEESNLDESSIVNFAEFVAFQASQDKLLTVKQEMKAEISAITGKNPEQLGKVQAMLEKLFEYVTHLRKEFSNLQESFSQVKRESEENQHSSNNSKKFTQSLQKENIFMSENIKRIASEKIRIEKQLAESERKVRTLEEKLRKAEESSRKKEFRSSEMVMKKGSVEEHDRSLDLNQFIEQNLNVANQAGKQKHRFALVSRHSKM